MSRQLHDLLELYVVCALDGEELDTYVTHLDDCDVCTTRLPAVMEAAAAMIPDSPPPRHLWASISAAIGTS